MARELDDLELWLPSEFLTDDDLLNDFKTDRFGTRRTDSLLYGIGDSLGLNSDLSSPVPSVTGTMETESDDDDFVTELSRKVARSTLHDCTLSSNRKTEGWKLPGSPQSTLRGYQPVSKVGPNFVPSPPEAKDVLRRDLLYAAAEEVARMQMIEETAAFYSTQLLAPPPKPGPVIVSQQTPNPAPGIYPNQTQELSHRHLQAAHQMKKYQTAIKNGGLERGLMEYQNARTGRGGRVQGLSMSDWPTLQQSKQQQHRPGSGMTALFLGETGTKKERTGTGVFMPRRFGTNPTETRKKPGCSTVLLPDRVVHALNLNLDSTDAHVHPRGKGRFNTECDAAWKNRDKVILAQARTSVGPQPVLNQELRLPQEWTY